MQYLGGKQRNGARIAYHLNQFQGMKYWEPFCGGMNIVHRLEGHSEYIASDIHKPLITMYKAIQKGWVPPIEVSEELYKECQKRKWEESPLVAWVGFASSFGGKYFGGYARGGNGRNYAKGCWVNLLKRILGIQKAKFYCLDFKVIVPKRLLIYCDPPYQDTTKYSNDFNHSEFWEWVIKAVRNDCRVLVSERTKQPFHVLEEFELTTLIKREDRGLGVNVDREYLYLI